MCSIQSMHEMKKQRHDKEKKSKIQNLWTSKCTKNKQCFWKLVSPSVLCRDTEQEPIAIQ